MIFYFQDSYFMVKNSQLMVKNRRFGSCTYFYSFFTQKYSLALVTHITFG